VSFGSPLPDPHRTRLRSHLESQYGIRVAGMAELDTGVFRVDRTDGPSWVARHFPAGRPLGATVGDGEILRFLAEHDYPAERCATPDPVSVLDGNGLLVTEYVRSGPAEQRKAAIRDLGGLGHLGELLGRLHTLPDTVGAVAREGGAWHHLADGGPDDELAAAGHMLAAAEDRVRPEDRSRYRSLVARLDALDSARGLPRAFIHPDFVLRNVIASPDRGMVVVDWASAGRGPRLWALAFLLLAEGAKNLRRVDLVVAGYRQHIDVEPEELTRLAAVARTRPVVFETWKFCRGGKALAAVARDVAATGGLADAVASRARAAFGARANA
jgi:Ser/Thr protein kinase RdoA (MazF antagonist)